MNPFGNYSKTSISNVTLKCQMYFYFNSWLPSYSTYFISFTPIIKCIFLFFSHCNITNVLFLFRIWYDIKCYLTLEEQFLPCNLFIIYVFLVTQHIITSIVSFHHCTHPYKIFYLFLTRTKCISHFFLCYNTTWFSVVSFPLKI